jgi:hypothetical protein
MKEKYDNFPSDITKTNPSYFAVFCEKMGKLEGKIEAFEWMLRGFCQIREATFTSVWDGGFEITTDCKVNMETNEVFDIEIADVDGLEILEKEYIVVDDVEYPVFQLSDITEEDNEFWYD